MRYCIGCVHFDLTSSVGGCMGSEDTGIYGEEAAAVFCKLGHWREELGESAELDDFRRAMEKAATCADYSERQAP